MWNVLVGKLLREVEPELMDALIHCTKDGDWSRLQGFSGLEEKIAGEENEECEEREYESEEEVYWIVISFNYYCVNFEWYGCAKFFNLLPV